jgi:hypothetical protein
MEIKYKTKDLIQSIQSSFSFMISCLSFANYFHRLGKTHVLPNLKDLLIDDYFISREAQKRALTEGKFARIAMSAALRSVFISMNEVLQKNPQFQALLADVLEENLESFSDLIKLLRNAYSHEITWASTGDIILKNEDFTAFMNFRKSQAKPSTLSIDFLYSDKFPGFPAPPEYGLKLRVPLENLREGENLSSIISLHHQFMIAELCYNMCILLASKEK